MSTPSYAQSFMSPYMPKGLTDGSIPSSYASYIQANPQYRVSYANNAGLTVTPQTELPEPVRTPLQ